MKIIFFGSGDYVSPIIETLKKNFELVEVVTPQTEISEKADLGIVASYGKIITPVVLESFPNGVINIHPSLLPKYRGPSPVQTTILNGDKKTGITIIKIDEKVDHGPILVEKEIGVTGNENSEILLKKLFGLGAEMLSDIISKYIKGQIKLTSQNDSKATFTKLFTKKDGLISLKNPPHAGKLDRMIRAFYPWPGVWFKTNLEGKNLIIKLLPSNKIQVEGKKPMSFKDFMNGYKKGGIILSKLRLQ